MNTFDPQEVGKRLVQLREYLRLNQGEFADTVGIDRSSYSKIEKGTKPLKAEMAYAISERWGASMDFLYRGRLTDLPHKMAEALMASRTNLKR
ncbi:helix-turn-helix domain-containing protein [Pseudooceanicola sp. CBS1P-1]|uniref:Helix-turn-helix domain-containing protein n=1 Tax=Pseudooceanicola albus TaxID=2692189 RepID=A0A6L7FWR8_9RHOB|nr:MULTISPECIES: helix-turn-helix transcriptional regulator [Pseudooceanicola]MBT9383473.1 helix-turn-helix domain-containing protein [Pseudooceanicola endophyticus]MXN16205.1 helix-turn-helix domain-containing protein [Pseudooceanicola albus]